MRDAENAARALDLELKPTQVAGQNDIEAAIRELGSRPGGGLITLTDAFMTDNRDLIIAMTAFHRVPAVYHNRNFPRAGGLLAYVGRLSRPVAPRRELRRPHPQGRETGGSSGAAAEQV